jgi:non-heme chloroperoxidase
MEHWIRVEPNVKIYVNDINPLGSKAILFVHGWPANHQMFEYQYNQLVPMGYRCIGMDMRGFGNSDKLASEKSSSIPKYRSRSQTGSSN